MNHNFFFLFDGGDDFGFNERDGKIIGWVLVVFGIFFLIALMQE